jgi:hypothetical protein
MCCDYCGLATGAVACWEVSSGAPGDGMTRYVCGRHLVAAVAQVGLTGRVQVFPTNTVFWERQQVAEVVVLPQPAERIEEAA